MKYLFIFLSTIFIFSCTENDQKKDTELNTYYSKYLYIYENYDSLGFDKSIELLDEYIEEFPNAQNAYLLKAFFLTQNGKLNLTEPLFQKAISYDSTNADIYVHWTSLLLTDSNMVEKAKEVNNIGKSIDTTNQLLANNETWIYLYDKDYEKALQSASKLVNITNKENNTFNRVLLISSIASKNDSVFNYAFLLINKEDSIELSNLEAYKNGEIELNTMYKSLTK